MSHEFVSVQWSKLKIKYDVIVLLSVLIFLAAFIGIGLMKGVADLPILIIRALGTCAFVLLHIILAIGPLARLSGRFKPILFNRRHFGVITALVALGHAGFTLMWYHGGGVLNPVASAIGGYGNYGVAIEFPFENLGLIALIILLVMATTSHDFWLNRLSPPVWKVLHMGVYFAYAALVGHVALGTAQFDKSSGILWAVAGGAIMLTGLHFAAMIKGRGLDTRADSSGAWINVGPALDIPMNKAVTVTPKSGERIAVFRHDKGVSAIDAVCSHQNGPLGEGCVLGGFITCPWHGFQFDPETGEAPAPYKDKVKTHEVKIENGHVLVRAEPDPFGTVRKSLQVSS